MSMAKKSSLSWLVITVAALRITTETSCILNYIQSVRLHLVQRLFERRGLACTAFAYKAILVGLVSLYFGLAFTALYLHGYIYYAALLCVAVCILTTGYFIPCLLRITQVNLAAGLAPLFKPRITFGPEAMDLSDLSIDPADGDKEPQKRPLDDDFFSDWQNKSRKSGHGRGETASGKKHIKSGRYVSLIVPYFSLIASVCCLLVMLAGLWRQAMLCFE